ncbi:MAG TPA: hypothetical protein DHV14_08715 [Micrococcales bacterium]|uniref:hypothetical protein n=1 Tax=Miniimonas arenae TaxID=676201 RepID=UPI000ED29FDD|nr:hypothetical protein [Miniimonas arenae]HCX85201.1 hypothetical protein [Micrococcales bacterium]
MSTRRVDRSVTRALGPLLAVVLLAGCTAPGTGGAGASQGASAGPAGVTAAAGPGGTVYTAATTLLQRDGADPVACLGGVLESYPPQCSGPVVIGLSWNDVADAEHASGVTWGNGWVVGTYDEDRNTLTLTRRVATEAPDGVEPANPALPALAPLCEDPWRGGDESAVALMAGPDGPELPTDAIEAANLLHERATALPGYVETYVSDGVSAFNVLLTAGSDLEAAHRSLREVWPGWLCVGTTDSPSSVEAQQASDALAAHAEELRLLGWGADQVSGTFRVSVLVDEPELRSRLEAVLAPWYPADRVELEAALRPLPADS